MEDTGVGVSGSEERFGIEEVGGEELEVIREALRRKKRWEVSEPMKIEE